LKSQVVINGRTRQVICTHQGRGPVHDFALYQRSKVEPHESLEVLADSGYQGLQKLHEKSKTPRKKPRKSKLTEEQKQSNRELARRRVVVEHVIRSLKSSASGRVSRIQIRTNERGTHAPALMV
jgi:IS5 family transposase